MAIILIEHIKRSKTENTIALFDRDIGIRKKKNSKKNKNNNNNESNLDVSVYENKKKKIEKIKQI
ncbi:hypothetical protein QR98_0093350 [Sarcoptes scabiei]|uniref:Uncharacterized protein n=1 Tax=Sarcoptes scabiei TaxID=52283 RepID=A0A132AIE2_SARSC|nr:hypothetical protein QR98_0093350 [Sarcoptes scabiei]